MTRLGRLPKRHRPGSDWRTLAHERADRTFGADYVRKIEDDSANYESSEFDELVIDSWLHVEQMNSRDWWMRVGPLVLNVHVGEHGEAAVVSVEQEDKAEDGWVYEESMSGTDIYKRLS